MHHLRVIAYLSMRLRSKIWLPTSLLYVLATELMAFSIGVAAFYIYLSLVKAVSENRREMNSSAYHAQLFFGRREFLLHLTANLALPMRDVPLNSSSEALHMYTLGESAGDHFGMAGKGLLPEFMLLRKSVGEAGWVLSYYMPLRQLAKDNAWKLQLAMLLCLGFIGLMPLSVYLIRRFILVPAFD